MRRQIAFDDMDNSTQQQRCRLTVGNIKPLGPRAPGNAPHPCCDTDFRWNLPDYIRKELHEESDRCDHLVDLCNVHEGRRVAGFVTL